MKKMFLIILLILVLALSGCGKSQEMPSNQDQNMKAPIQNDLEVEDIDLPEESIEETNEFSIIVGDKVVSLMDWDDQVNLEELFGKHNEEVQYQLGPESDTFSGSYLKELRYDGIELKLFSPKDNGNSFFILNMYIDHNNYQTPRGIRVGDTLDDLNEKYPEIKPVLDGRQDGTDRYVIEEGAYNYLVFEIEEDVIVNIRIYHEFA